MVKAKKTYKRGGKVVAQGADKADVRAERKQARAKRKDERSQERSRKKGSRQLKKDIKAGKLTKVAPSLVRINEDPKKKSKSTKGLVKRTVTKGKAEGEKSKTVITSIGNRTRVVTKQENKSADGVKSKRKTVYGPDTGNIRTKEKQRTNRKGKKAGMISFKEKNVDRKDFTEKNKRK